MDLVYEAFADLRLTENHIRQLHQTLLRHSHTAIKMSAIAARTRQTCTTRRSGEHKQHCAMRPRTGSHGSASSCGCLKKQKDGLAAPLDRERIAEGSDADLPELSLRILESLCDRERLTIAELATITRGNRNTLKVRLRALLVEGRVRRHGKARATWYSYERASNAGIGSFGRGAVVIGRCLRSIQAPLVMHS